MLIALPLLFLLQVQSREDVAKELVSQGVSVDFKRSIIEIQGEIAQTHDPLEYLIVQERGKEHEALFSIPNETSATAFNTAILLLGLNPGKNGAFKVKDPRPSREEYEAGVSLYDVEAAAGDGLFISIGWETKDPLDGHVERHMHRAEDLVLNQRRQDTYRRGPWIYLGSRFIRPHKDAPEMFAAEAEGNWVSLVYFSPANHLMTGADPDADDQYSWFPNYWLLPSIGHPVKIWLSLAPLESWPSL